MFICLTQLFLKNTDVIKIRKHQQRTLLILILGVLNLSYRCSLFNDLWLETIGDKPFVLQLLLTTEILKILTALSMNCGVCIDSLILLTVMVVSPT
jgi:hypothetical protein